MSTLREIRARIALQQIQSAKARQEKPKPITYEQHQVWQTLKGTPTKEGLPMVNSRDSVDNILECPCCGCSYLHHVGVELFNRNEDDESGEHIQLYVKESYGWNNSNIIAPDHSIDNNMQSNPSLRRTGIIVKFACEDCGEIVDLCFAQHKGMTLTDWRYNK